MNARHRRQGVSDGHRGRRIGVAAAAVGVVVIAVAAWFGTRGPVPATMVSVADGSDPRGIAGGRFEASGVVHVPGTSQLLFVDDGRTREILLMELGPDGSQNGAARSIPLAADVTDLEGITSDGRHFYVVGSQSKKTGYDGDGLVRFTFDPSTGRADGVERIQGLMAWLATNVAELRGTETRVGDEVLNIEGLAWDPKRRRLLLGFRAPVVDGAALIVPIRLIDSTASFSRENLRVDGSTIRVDLDGAGIRGLEYDQHAAAFRIITGAGANEENREFRVVEWNGDSGAGLRDILSYDRRLKPEGITRLTLAGRPVSVVVFDVGSFVVVD
jgi:hypothetical protein